MTKIPMVDLHTMHRHIEGEIKEAVSKVIETSSFIKGYAVDTFAGNLARAMGVKHVIPVANGTDALRISMLALGLRPGDEVITPSFTFVATAEAAVSIGCTPVFVDVDPDTFCISANEISQAITPRTKAIVPVHLFGQNAPMEEILSLARRHGIKVIEDACQSINSLIITGNGDTRKSGTMGDMGCTSFFPSKNLGCMGDGGAIFTNSSELAELAHSIANHGMKQKYQYDRIGMNSRLDAIQAAILDVKLKHLDHYNSKRQKAAQLYDSLLAHAPVVTPFRAAHSTHVFHQYTIKVDKNKRDALQAYLSQNGIASMIYYPTPIHQQPPYKIYAPHTELKTTEMLCKSVLSLPMHTELTAEQQSHVAQKIINFFN